MQWEEAMKKPKFRVGDVVEEIFKPFKIISVGVTIDGVPYYGGNGRCLVYGDKNLRLVRRGKR